ncbi:MAG: glycine/sarcosine/betaine reductase selenoprotein B family protein [Bryobacteraceae bacterium]
MGKLSDLKLKYQLLIKGYPFRRVDWRPGATLTKPLNQARIALVTTAGFYLSDQQPFDQSFRHDDCSYREIPWGTPTSILQIGQSSDAFDHSGIESDRNLTLPLDRLEELIEAGIVGSSAKRHFSIMGSIIAPAKLINESAPEIALKLVADQVDAVLLAPVCPFCHQAAGLLQSIIEKAGIPTVSISLLMEITRQVEPPRVLVVDRPLGYPLGEPNHPELQKRIMLAALALLAKSIQKPLVRAWEEPSSAG